MAVNGRTVDVILHQGPNTLNLFEENGNRCSKTEVRERGRFEREGSFRQEEREVVSRGRFEREREREVGLRDRERSFHKRERERSFRERGVGLRGTRKEKYAKHGLARQEKKDQNTHEKPE